MKSIIKFADYKVFDDDNRKFIYCIEDNKVFEIDSRFLQLLSQNGKTYAEIEDNLSSVFGKEELNELIRSMYEFNLIKIESNAAKRDSDETSNGISTLLLLVAQSCNLRCSYCYADEGKYHDSGKMDLDTAQKAVDFLLSKSSSDKLSICFFGGEPLLNFALIKETVAYCHDKEKETGKKFGFSMTTNGTLINEEIEKFIIENQIKTQISIDGDQKTHDANRYFSGKLGSYETVLKKTQSLRKKGLLDARGTITPKELNLVHIYDFLHSIGFRNVALAPAVNLFEANEYSALADSYSQFYLHCEELIKEKKYEEIRNNGIMIKILGDIHNATVRTKACGACSNLYAIDINGDIYPCQRFVDAKETCIGNVFVNDGKRKDFLERASVNNFKKCCTCWIRNLCVGGCIHDNYSFMGDIQTPYEPNCEYRRKVATEAIKIYIRLSDDEILEIFKS
jgi:uncharacterized protein